MRYLPLKKAPTVRYAFFKEQQALRKL
jgi:hypothetical protein